MPDLTAADIERTDLEWLCYVMAAHVCKDDRRRQFHVHRVNTNGRGPELRFAVGML